MGWNEYLFFLGPSKLLFFDSFQSADLHFVWFVVAILEMFLRGKSRAPPTYPTRVRTHQTHINAATGMRAHHPAHDHSPHELSVFIFGGPRVFWFVALALRSTSSTVCFLSTCPWSMEKILFLFLLDYIFFNPILVVSRSQSLEKKKNAVCVGVGGCWTFCLSYWNSLTGLCSFPLSSSVMHEMYIKSCTGWPMKCSWLWNVNDFPIALCNVTVKLSSG